MIEVVVCKTGLARHAPDLDLPGLGTVDCFDRCETCEKFLLARVDGALMRLKDVAELRATLEALEG